MVKKITGYIEEESKYWALKDKLLKRRLKISEWINLKVDEELAEQIG